MPLNLSLSALFSSCLFLLSAAPLPAGGRGRAAGGRGIDGAGKPDLSGRTAVPFQPQYDQNYGGFQPMGPGGFAPPPMQQFGQGVMYYPQFQPTPQLEGPALMAAIKTQVEYYFSTNNLVKDVFLRSQMNAEGFIQLSCIMGFKRMTMLSTNPQQIKDAIADSSVVRLHNSIFLPLPPSLPPSLSSSCSLLIVDFFCVFYPTLLVCIALEHCSNTHASFSVVAGSSETICEPNNPQQEAILDDGALVSACICFSI